eukprot:scaffold97248_cov63-Phaeocystis_antarctica.AAC.2
MAPEGGTGRSDAETGRMSNVAGCHRILSWSCDDVAAVPRGACTRMDGMAIALRHRKQVWKVGR